MSPRDIALALGVVLIWGLNFIAIKWSVAEISPFLLTALRYIGCAVPAIFFIRRPNVRWPIMIAYGLTVGVLQFSFLFTAMQLGMPAGLASLIIQCQVFFTMALAILFLGERPAPVQLGGAAIALAGLAAIASEHLGGAILIPFGMTLVAAFFWASSNIVTKRAGQIDMLAFVVWSSLVPPIPMLTLSLLLEGPGPLLVLPGISLLALCSVLFIAYGSTLMGYGAWAMLLGKYPASLVTPFSLLVPVVGFAAAYLMLGEQVSHLEVLGSLLIFVGLMPPRHILLALLVVCIWGFNFVVIKLSVQALPPLLAAALRFAFAALPLSLVVKPPKAHWALVMGFGLAFGFGMYTFLNLALAWGMPAGLSSLVLQVQAFFTMALAFWLLDERPSRFQVIGALIAFGGIGVIAAQRIGGASILPLGLTLIAALCWGLANVLTKKAGQVNALSLTVWGALTAPLPLFGLSLLVEGPGTVMAALRGFGWSDLGLVVFLAYPATLLGGAIWAWLLARHKATVVAPFTLLVPIVGIVSGYLVLGETITLIEIAGGLLVIAGLVVTLLRGRASLPLQQA